MSNVVSGPNHHDFNQSQIDFTNNTWNFQHGWKTVFRSGRWAIADPRGSNGHGLSGHPVNEIKLILYFCWGYGKPQSCMRWTDELFASLAIMIYFAVDLCLPDPDKSKAYWS